MSAPPLEQIPGELLLRLDQLVDLLLHGAAADELVHQHVLGLADAEGAVGGLVLHRRIPPAIEMDDMRGGGEVEPGAAGLEREHEERDAFVLLELAHQILALLHLGLAVQDEAGPAEHGAEERRQRRGHLPELGEDEHLLLPGGDHLGDLAQPRELAAVLLGPGAVAEPLRGMVADLLEPHQEGEHDAPALDAVGVVELVGEVVHRLLVERRLLAAQRAERLHLGLVGQVGDDALVGLQAPQNVGAHQLAQRAVGIVRPVGEAFGERRELLRRSQQPGIDEVEDRPQVAEPVLDRRAGERDARVGLELLDGPGLLGAGILDRLRLVEHGQAPRRRSEPGRAGAESRSW